MSTGPGHYKWFMPYFSCGLLLVSSCQSLLPGIGRDIGNGVDCLEEESSRSFREICRELKNSDGFRQNVWLCGKLEVRAAICMDMDRRLYLVVWSEHPALTAKRIDESYRRLMVAPDILRSRMDPDAFILGQPGGSEPPVGIFQIPDDAGESFGIDLINHLFNLDLKSEDQRFGWD
jgi:hypothetical protein